MACFEKPISDIYRFSEIFPSEDKDNKFVFFSSISEMAITELKPFDNDK